jgi:hypothetical protein
MTTDKARKRAVRTRMQKTGERYAAARRHVARPAIEGPAALEASPAPDLAPTPASPPAPAPVPDLDPGWPEATILKGTGHGWAHWLTLLDEAGAPGWTHTEIARWLVATQGIGGWWAQTVTVGYERARGRRAMHQTARGFEVSVSKTIRAPLSAVWGAVLDPDRRAAWLDEAVTPTTSRDGVVARFTVPATGAALEVAFDPKAAERTTVTVAVRKLRDAEDIERHREVWRGHLRRLEATVLTDAAVAQPGSRTS